MVKRANSNAHRAAVIIAEIREAKLITYISELTIAVVYWVVVQGLRGALPDAGSTAFTVFCNPAVFILLAERQVPDTGKDGRQTHARSMFRRNDDSV